MTRRIFSLFGTLAIQKLHVAGLPFKMKFMIQMLRNTMSRDIVARCVLGLMLPKYCKEYLLCCWSTCSTDQRGFCTDHFVFFKSRWSWPWPQNMSNSTTTESKLWHMQYMQELIYVYSHYIHEWNPQTLLLFTEGFTIEKLIKQENKNIP